MAKHFGVSEKKLLKRYNSRILKLNVLPVCIILTLLAIVFFNRGDVMPVEYYSFFFRVSSVCLGYSFLATLIGSVIATVRLNGNKKHTFVSVDGKYLIVSRYLETMYFAPKTVDYKEMYIIKLDEIGDVYTFKTTIIIAAPTRKVTGQADWLEYKLSDGVLVFGDGWNSECAGTFCGGVEIKNMYRYPLRIAKTVENLCGSSKEQLARRQEFREYMLSVTQSEAYRKARQRIRR